MIMASDCKHPHPLQHDGTCQDERFLAALEPDNAPIHQFDLREWLRFAYHYAARLNYFAGTDTEHPDDNWRSFVPDEGEIDAWLKDAALIADEKWLPTEERERILKRTARADYPPHLALFLTFLQLMRFPHAQINGLTARHLEFYYRRVLRLSNKPAVPDRVHLLFELVKNAAPATVPSGTLLDAGKDVGGKPLRYATTEEITVNSARVVMLKSIHHLQGQTIRYAEMTNSQDGRGTEFTVDNPSWNPFGSALWPTARLGFALASAVLLLHEGERTITVTIDLTLNLAPAQKPPASQEAYQGQLLVLFSGEKEWLPATVANVSKVPDANDGRLVFTITVGRSQPAILPYNAAILGERFTTHLPVMRVLVDTGQPVGYRIYALLSAARITKVEIGVQVTGLKHVTVENDQGRLDPTRPFYPFGPVPKIGASLYLGSHEIFQKNWQQVCLNIGWQGKREDLGTHYLAYRTPDLSGTAIITDDSDFTVIPQYLRNAVWQTSPDTDTTHPLFAPQIQIMRQAVDDSIDQKPPVVPSRLLKKGIDVNKVVLDNYLAGNTGDGSRQQQPVSAPFKATQFDPGFTRLNVTPPSLNSTTQSGFLRLVLQQDFLHDQYPKLLIQRMIDQAKPEPIYPSTTLNAPYTPTIATLTLDYTASESNRFAFDKSATAREKFDDFAARTIQLFHEHPFGQAEQHPFLKEQCPFFADPTAARTLTLMPPCQSPGELFIGISHAQPSGSLSLLMAVVEGSEDPLAATFTAGQRIGWSSLTNNEWQSLNAQYLTGDDTNNLLRSGIVRLNLPATIHTGNTLLDADYFWLRAQLPPGVDPTSVCRLSGIHAQAVTAVFRDNGNDPAHAANPRPAGTITQVVATPVPLKSVQQPYPSFGGVGKEGERAFSLRVSERLRHKQRAVTLWDYERLVLEQFPAVHKVKCLSHTVVPGQAGDLSCCEVAPGAVLLLVIPDIRNKNFYDPLRPRASQNLLREIEQFLSPLIGLHVRCHAASPDYETIRLDFRVKFHARYDASAYLKVLNADIVRYLSPWAFGDYADLHFGGRLYKSVIIRFIEEREYVDFLSQFRMYHLLGQNDTTPRDTSEIAASSARAILVSAQQHAIKLIESDKVCNE